jgi:hypothetical protein
MYIAALTYAIQTYKLVLSNMHGKEGSYEVQHDAVKKGCHCCT